MRQRLWQNNFSCEYSHWYLLKPFCNEIVVTIAPCEHLIETSETCYLVAVVVAPCKRTCNGCLHAAITTAINFSQLMGCIGFSFAVARYNYIESHTTYCCKKITVAVAIISCEQPFSSPWWVFLVACLIYTNVFSKFSGGCIVITLRERNLELVEEYNEGKLEGTFKSHHENKLWKYVEKRIVPNYYDDYNGVAFIFQVL